jgi:hypothetical protein
MIVYDFDIASFIINPRKANTPLRIDPNTILTGSISGQLFQTISGRCSQILYIFGFMQIEQFATRGSLDISG